MMKIEIDPAYADTYRDVLQAEIDNIQSGSTSYGMVVDNEEIMQALQALVNQLDDVARVQY